IFSHNPGITYFVNSLVPGVSLDNMPTCGVFAIEAEAARWKDFEKSRRRYLFFDYPKSSGT
ncbi:MAG TPA: histidine phosphatase family protein, partial [Ferruginibacter sp.]|nr:histidine phosphatase family protein [Ferruginibacter sp.]